MDRYLSIITNFGCHYSCPYCVVKNNGLKIPKTTIESLEHLEPMVIGTRANIVSISGGGDPLFKYENNIEYYSKLKFILDKLNVKFEMHTSYFDSQFPFEECYRVVYHLRNVEDLGRIKRRGNEIVRVVFVVDESFTDYKALNIARYVMDSENIDELSFRQMIDSNYQTTYYLYDFLKQYHQKLWWYIEQNDYNTYFCEGKLYNKYRDITEEVND